MSYIYCIKRYLFALNHSHKTFVLQTFRVTVCFLVLILIAVITVSILIF